MDLKKYKQQTKPLTVKLTAGESLDLEYYPNYLTGLFLRSLEEEQERIAREREKAKEASKEAGKDEVVDDSAGETDFLSSMHQSFVSHLCGALHRVDVTDDGKPVRFQTPEQKASVLKQFSYDDVRLLSSAINNDIYAPLVKTGTDSSAGPQPKEE